eukprot:SAG11_NODE_441_length_9431_cov_29.928847_1_plen_76_part_00
MHVLSKHLGVGPVERVHKVTKSRVHSKERGNLRPKNVAREVFINVNRGAMDELEANEWVETYWEADSSDEEVEED